MALKLVKVDVGTEIVNPRQSWTKHNTREGHNWVYEDRLEDLPRNLYVREKIYRETYMWERNGQNELWTKFQWHMFC
jgi:hypothetical protein